MISGSNWLKGVAFATFAILAMKEATSSASENERRPEVMRSLCSFYANDALWVLIFEEEKFSYNQTTQPPREIKKWQFHSLFTRRSLFSTIFKKNVSTVQTYLFPAVIRFVFRMFFEIWIAVPKWAIFYHFVGNGPQTATFATFYNVFMFRLFFVLFVCLFVVVVVFLHRIRPDVRSSSCWRSRAPGWRDHCSFQPYPWQIQAWNFLCSSNIWLYHILQIGIKIEEREKHISAHARDSRDTRAQKITAKSFNWSFNSEQTVAAS